MNREATKIHSEAAHPDLRSSRRAAQAPSTVLTVVGDAMEGWYTDPFERHEARWLSAGRPTKLVRDGTVESYDEPPDEEPIQVPERIEVDPSSSGAEDLRRADEAERDMPSADAIADAVSIAFERSRPPGP